MVILGKPEKTFLSHGSLGLFHHALGRDLHKKEMFAVSQEPYVHFVSNGKSIAHADYHMFGCSDGKKTT